MCEVLPWECQLMFPFAEVESTGINIAYEIRVIAQIYRCCNICKVGIDASFIFVANGVERNFSDSMSFTFNYHTASFQFCK